MRMSFLAIARYFFLVGNGEIAMGLWNFLEWAYHRKFGIFLTTAGI